MYIQDEVITWEMPGNLNKEIFTENNLSISPEAEMSVKRLLFLLIELLNPDCAFCNPDKNKQKFYSCYVTGWR